MIYIRSGAHVLELLQLLSVAGEFPMSGLSILGNPRTMRELIHRLEDRQEIEASWSGKRYCARLLSISGKRGPMRNIRLHKSALPLLDELHPAAMDYYLSAFRNHAFSGKRGDIERNHRVAETLAMMFSSGIEIRPYLLPRLQTEHIEPTVGDMPCFYPSRIVKKLDGDSMNKTGFTRMTGLLLKKGVGFAVYNTRNAVMKWHGDGELKAMQQCEDLARRNAGVDALCGAILFGRSGSVALDTLMETNKAGRRDCRIDRIYMAVHFAPLNNDGKRLLHLLTIPALQARLRSVLFPHRLQVNGFVECDCDAVDGGKYILSHLDGDLARLVRFRLAAIEDKERRYEAICYPWQLEYVKPFLGEHIELKLIDPARIAAALQRR